MPALPPASLLGSLASRNALNSTPTANSTSAAIHVVCAWPVSGQYGPGSRVLYYALVAACVIARKREWLRNACLAAALLFPAVAAIHGIVLASVHVNGAVDLDVFGAFQLCSIGILAAPLTVKLSRTYFNDPGRNMIFLWTILILAGLLSLTVEFYRANTTPCSQNNGSPIPHDTASFLNANTTCGITCWIGDPTSPIRGGTNDNIYVIPAPDQLTFNTAMLLAAACCIPAILTLIFTFDKILDVNWKRRAGQEEEDAFMNREIDGTNGATEGKMRGVNSIIRQFLGVIEVPVFAATILAILVLGERNFFSYQLKWQTEPMASIGQWAPIAGTVLAAMGSLYLLLTGNLEEVNRKQSTSHCDCHNHDGGLDRTPTINLPSNEEQSLTGRSSDDDLHDPVSNEIMHTTSTQSQRSPTLPIHRERTNTTATDDTGNRRRVAKWLKRAGDHLGSAAHEQYDMSPFDRGRAIFPETPGEHLKNKDLARTRTNYRDAVMSRQHSRGRSNTSIRSANGDAQRHPSPSPPGPESPGLESSHRRRATLEVPPAAHHSPRI